MIKKGLPLFLLVTGITAIMFSGCKTDPPASELSLRIRLPNEPENLHPIFSKSAYASQIETLILLPIAEYDPISQELSPLLLIEIPKAEKIETGPHANGIKYKLQFRKEATWSDGKPVTGEDYVFSIKCVYNPHINAPGYRGFYDYISEVKIDPSDPRVVEVFLDSAFMLSLESAVNWNLYPAHIYDPGQIMARFTLEELRNPQVAWTSEQDTLLKQFAASFESVNYFRETVSGAGAYELDAWSTGEFIRLKRKENWWGDKIENAPLLLQAYPKEITYRIILDAAAAEAALKAGEIDLMAEVPAENFLNLQNDATWKDKFQFATPPLMLVNYLELNTRDSILADKRIRHALSHAIDYDGIVKEILKGMASRAVGPIHAEKEYCNKELKPIVQDLNQSMDLIKKAGWTDTNGNGTPDKMIGGKREELQLTIKIQNKEEGSIIANIVKENAAKIGMDIRIEVVEPGQFSQDIRQRNFDIVPVRVNSFPSLYDPFQLWHSLSDRPGGSNRSGFHTPELDSIIEEIRTVESEPKRIDAYNRFQEIIYDAQPSIFLYAPLERIIATKQIKLITTSRRPGYFENLIRPAG